VDETVTNVLLIEDNTVEKAVFTNFLSRAQNVRMEVEHCRDLLSGLERMRDGAYDVLVLDLTLPDSWGLDTLRRVFETDGDVPVVVLTGSEEIEQALEAVREGAADYLFKGQIDGDNLIRSVRYAVERGVRRRMEESAQAARREMEIARRIQQSLYPRISPDVPGYDIAGTSRMAAEVGGDYFDFLLLSDDSLGIVIADAMGHGVGAALLAAQARAALRALVPNSHRVGELIAATDHVLQSPLDDIQLITLLLARLLPDTGEFYYASAGHESGLIFNAQGDIRTRLDSTTFPVGGQLNGKKHEHVKTRVLPGDTVVLVTDGIREAAASHGARFGRERLAEVVRTHLHEPARQIVEALVDAVCRYCHPHPPTDDVTAVVIKVSPDFE
jgi:serine phosphatase RsbU (regulator of sigma subunit)